MMMAETMRALRDELKINLVFKASFDKANRTSISSFRARVSKRDSSCSRK